MQKEKLPLDRLMLRLMMKEHELLRPEGQGGVSAPLLIAELDFEDTWRECLDDRPHLTADEPALRQVHQQGHY